MKLSFCCRSAFFLLLVLYFIFFITPTSGRSLGDRQEMMNEEPNHGTGKEYILEGNQAAVTDLDELLGAEYCDNEDVECVQRRLISEAHLDYIYTQHHKP